MLVQHTQSGFFKPKLTKKTALELRILEEQDKHPVEKKDLFNSIFNSSDEDSDDEQQVDNKVANYLTIPEKLSLPQSVISLIASPTPLSLDKPNKPSNVQNVQKQTSITDAGAEPYKILFKPIKKIVIERESTEKIFMYGPIIPQNIKAVAPDNDVCLVASNDSNDSWIEKACDSNKKERLHHKHKKSRKHKKQKHKNKKSKK